jgi:hypothetical protein
MVHRAVPKLAHWLATFGRSARRLPTSRHLRMAFPFKIVVAAWTLALVLSTGSGTATAAELVDNDAGTHQNNIDAIDKFGTDYTIRLNPLPSSPTALGFTTYELDSVKAAGMNTANKTFKDWTITNANPPARLPGTLTIDRYDAYKNAAANSFSVTYNSGPQPNADLFHRLYAGTSQLVWIQLVTTNSPCPSPRPPPPLPKPYLDPQCIESLGYIPDDDFPFYWTAAENVDTTHGGFSATLDGYGKVTAVLTFWDIPERGLDGGNIDWQAHLAIAEWDKATTVTIYDSIFWGFKIICNGGPNLAGTDSSGGAAGDKEGEDTGLVPSPLVCGSVGGIAELPDMQAGQAAREGSARATDEVWLIGIAAAGGVLLASAVCYARRRTR